MIQLSQQAKPLTDEEQIKKKTNVVSVKEPEKASSIEMPPQEIKKAEVPTPTITPPVTLPPVADKIPLPGIATVQKISIGIPKTEQKLNSLIPSLNDLEKVASGEDDGKPKYISGDAKEPFSIEQFLVHWNQYAEIAKSEGKINIYTLLNTSDPVLENNDTIVAHIEHKIQESLLQDEMIDLLNYIRPRLKNFNVKVITKQIERVAVNRLYTSVEKYQYLLEKNNKLEELRARFNLDINS